MSYTTQQIDQDTVEVRLDVDPSYVGWVSSWHLVVTKANQLSQAYHHDRRTSPCHQSGPRIGEQDD